MGVHFMRYDRDLRRNLRFSSVDNFLFSVMVGAGETFLPAFALAMGCSQVAAGLLAALPFLAGSTLQLLAPRLMARVGSCRRWLVGAAGLQAISFLPLAAFAVRGKGIDDWILYALVTLYWACGLASGPVWSSWMSSLVPPKMRHRYFARRNHLGQLGLVLGLVGGGFLLQLAKNHGWELQAFAGLFFVSAFFRIGSAFCLSKKSESPSLVQGQRLIGGREILMRLRHAPEGRLVGFLLLFAVACNTSAPFFNPFMLKQLNLSYVSYMGLIAFSFAAKIAVFAWLSDTARRRLSPFRLMKIGVIGSAVLPLLWIVSSNYIYLSLAQVLSGLVWGLYDLGVMLALFHVVRDEERTSFLCLYNFAQAVMILVGTTLGGELLKALGENSRAYFTVFALSGAARFLSFIVLERAAEGIEGRSERFFGLLPSAFAGAFPRVIVGPFQSRFSSKFSKLPVVFSRRGRNRFRSSGS